MPPDTTSPTPARPIAVVGATGLQGGAVARALLAAGAPVRALTRQPEAQSARDLQDLGAEVVPADLRDPESLRRAFADVSSAFAMTTPGRAQDAEAEARDGYAIADAAADAGVPHVVYSSVGGAERHTGIPHFDSKRQVELRMIERGLSTTFVRPVFFMDNFAQFMVPALEAHTLVVRMPLPAGVPLQMIAVGDVGAAAAAAVLDPSRVVGGSIEIAGDELTGEQIAEEYGQRFGRPARYEPLPLDVLGDNADSRAMFGWFAELPAYQADFDGTRAMVPTTMSFRRWLQTQPDPADQGSDDASR